MQGLTKAQEEIKALEGLRSKRLNKYQEALRKQAESKPTTKLDVHQLEADRKKLPGFTKGEVNYAENSGTRHNVDGKIVADFDQRPEAQEEPRRDSHTFRSPTLKKNTFSNIPPHAPSDVQSPKLSAPHKSSVGKSPVKKELPPEVQKAKDEEEHVAKSTLAKLLDVSGEESIVVTGFSSIRKRYLSAIEACRPTTIDVSNSVELEAAKKRRAARREQAMKKDRMGKIQRAWDNYEEKAQDRPPARDNEEMIEEEKVAQVEAEVNNAWISYAKQVAAEAAEEEDDDDLEYWIAEAKRLKAEAEARRLARLKAMEERLRSEEDDYWIEEALKLRAKHKNKGKGPPVADADDDNDDVALALQLQAKQQKKTYRDNVDDDQLERKQFKKGRVYGSDSDSDADDAGGATFQKQQRRKKAFGHDDDSEGLAAKTSKKNRAYQDDSDSDLDYAGGATAQSKVRKDYGMDHGGALAVKSKKKSSGRGFDDDDSEDDRHKISSLTRKQGIQKKNYGSDSESSSANQESNATKQRKNYGNGDEKDVLPSKVSKKSGSTCGDNSDSSGDRDNPSHKSQRKSYGGVDNGTLAKKQFKKGRQYNSDSDSDSNDEGGATSQKQRRKNYGGDNEDGCLPAKHKKKDQRHQHNSSSESNDEETDGRAAKQRKNYANHDDNDVLPSKESKKSGSYGDDSDSSDDKGTASQKSQRKNYGGADSSTLDPKKSKKGRTYNSDSDSDSGDDGGRTHQQQQRKDYGADNANDRLSSKPRKKGQFHDTDSDNDVELPKQQRKSYGQSEAGDLPHKGRKKGRNYNSDSDSDTEDEAGASLQRRKNYGVSIGMDDKLSSKKKKKSGNYDPESDSDTNGKEASGPNEVRAEEDKDTKSGNMRRKNYGRTYSGDGLPSKQKKKKTFYLSENSDDNEDAAKPSLRRRKKDYGNGDVDGELTSKQSRKSSKFDDSDSSSSSEDEPSTEGHSKNSRNNNSSKSLKKLSQDDGDETDSTENDCSSLKAKSSKKKSYSDSDSENVGIKKASKKKFAVDDDESSQSHDESAESSNGESDESSDDESTEKQRRKTYESGDDMELKKKKKKKMFDPMSDSDDDNHFDTAKRSKSTKRKGKKKEPESKIHDSQSSFMTGHDSSLYSESQQSLNASFAGKGDTSLGAINYNNSVPNSKFYKSEYFDCPLEVTSSEEEEESVEMETKTPSPKRPSSKNAITLEESDEVLADEPTNPDGSPWKNPLKGWTNTPKKKMISKGARLIIKIPPKTDCWRKTMHDRVVDTAPFHWQKITGDFRILVKVSGSFSSKFQRAGLMVRLDKENWILSGMEFFENRIHHSTCFTMDHTDWSLCQLPHNAEKAGVWFSIKRLGGSYECHYSYDASKWVLTRQGTFTERPVLYVGICGANPTSDDLRVSFDYYRCQTGGYLM